MRLTKHFIRKKIKALAKQAGKRQVHFCALKDAHHIVVLFEATDREEVTSFLATLRSQQKQVQECLYVSEEVIPEIEESCSVVIHAKKDLNMWYTPSTEIKKQFCNLKADILIDLTHGDNQVMKYLMLNHPSRFKVGVKNDSLDLYDMAIALTEQTTLKQICKHILFYLQTIRS